MTKEHRIPKHFDGITFRADKHNPVTPGYNQFDVEIKYNTDVSNEQARNVQMEFIAALAEVCAEHKRAPHARGYVIHLNKVLHASHTVSTVELPFRVFKNDAPVDLLHADQKTFLEDLRKNLKRRLGPPSARRAATP
jgi:hypothetical protein